MSVTWANGGVTVRLEWRIDERRQYTVGEYLLLGKWRVGGAHYLSSVLPGSNERYAATCCLPGIKVELGRFTSMENAKERVERAVKHWLSNLQAVPQPKGE